MSHHNSTLNIINIEIAELKAKQTQGPLGIIDMKKLESLLNMKKTLHATPGLVDEHQEVDEDIFTDEEILEFIAARKVDGPKRNVTKANKTAVENKVQADESPEEEISQG